MTNGKPGPGQGDWIVTMDTISGTSGTIRVKLIGAKGGAPLAELEAFAVTPDDLIEFLHGAYEALARRYNKIVTARGFKA